MILKFRESYRRGGIYSQRHVLTSDIDEEMNKFFTSVLTFVFILKSGSKYPHSILSSWKLKFSTFNLYFQAQERVSHDRHALQLSKWMNEWSTFGSQLTVLSTSRIAGVGKSTQNVSLTPPCWPHCSHSALFVCT